MAKNKLLSASIDVQKSQHTSKVRENAHYKVVAVA
jgi:hypothetical protein